MKRIIYILLSIFIFAGCEEFDLGSIIQIGGTTTDKEESSEGESPEDSPSDNPSDELTWDVQSAFTTAHIGHKGL